MPERSHPNNLQKRFNSVISSIEPAGGVGDARITDDDRQALGAKDGNVHSVAVEDEAEAAGAVFAVAGTEGRTRKGASCPWNRSTLPHSARNWQGSLKNPCCWRKGILEVAEWEIDYTYHTCYIRMMKKLTITVSEEVYKGLYAKIGAGRISHFLDSLARAHVVDSAITEGYRAMGKDESRERDALDWSENLVGDIDHEAR